MALVPLAEARELALAACASARALTPRGALYRPSAAGLGTIARDYVTTTVDVQVVRNEVETATTTTCHMTVKFPGPPSGAVRISLTA